MAEQQRTDSGPQKRSLKLAPALGDWTTYKPSRVLIKKIKTGIYGFDRLSKEELQASHNIHYEFAEELCNALRVDLGIRSEIYNVDALQNNFMNFMEILSQPMVEGKINITDIHEDLYFALDLNISNTLINSLLGSKDQEMSRRDLTEAENKILQSALSNYQSFYNKGFNNILSNLKFEILPLPTIKSSLSVSTNASFICFSIELKLADSYGKILFGYPGKLLKGLLKKRAEADAGGIKINRLNPPVMEKISQPLKMVLGTTTISSGEINSIEAGDVLQLDQSIYSAIPAILGEKKVLMGQPVIKNGKRALKVISVRRDKNKSADLKITPPPVIEKEEEPAAETIEEQQEEIVQETEPVIEEQDQEQRELVSDEIQEETFIEEDPAQETETSEAPEQTTDEEFIEGEEDLGLDEEFDDEGFEDDDFTEDDLKEEQ